MPDSISQSTATVLRINGREMSYCAIFVRDLREAIPPFLLSLLLFLLRLVLVLVLFVLHTPFFASLLRKTRFVYSLARGGGYRRDASGERPLLRTCPACLPLRPRALRFFPFTHSHSLSLPLSFSPAP